MYRMLLIVVPLLVVIGCEIAMTMHDILGVAGRAPVTEYRVMRTVSTYLPNGPRLVPFGHKSWSFSKGVLCQTAVFFGGFEVLQKVLGHSVAAVLGLGSG